MLGKGLASFYSHISELFEAFRSHVHAIRFGQLSLQHLRDSSPEQGPTSALLVRILHAAIALSDFDVAAAALNRIPSRETQLRGLRDLVSRIMEVGAVNDFLELPLPTLQDDIDTLLTQRTRLEGEQSTVGPSGIPYFRILYAWRLRLGDTRGAAAVLIERLEATKQQKGHIKGKGGIAKQYERALDEYLVSINALALVGEGTKTDAGATTEEGWVFVEGDGRRRRVVRLQDLRNSYGEAMDRLGMLKLGRFGILDHNDESDDEDEQMM